MFRYLRVTLLVRIINAVAVGRDIVGAQATSVGNVSKRVAKLTDSEALLPAAWGFAGSGKVAA